MKTYTSKDLPKDGSEIHITAPMMGRMPAAKITLKWDKKNFVFKTIVNGNQKDKDTVSEKHVLAMLTYRYYIMDEKPTTLSYKQASKLPKGGAVEMCADHLRALAADIIARKHCLRPEAVYNWATLTGVDLQKYGYILSDIKCNTALLSDVMHDEYKETKELLEPVSESNHTPDESWKADHGGDRNYDNDSVTVSVYCNEGNVAKVTGGPNDIEGKKAFARANLIAAAPEMLEALKSFIEYLDSDLSEAEQILKAKAVAAIAKAEGR